MKGVIREIFSRMKWAPGEKVSDYIVIFVTRGAPGNIEKVNGEKIVKVGKGAIEVDLHGEIKYIPFHRIVAVIRRGEVLWVSPRWRELLPGEYQV